MSVREQAIEAAKKTREYRAGAFDIPASARESFVAAMFAAAVPALLNDLADRIEAERDEHFREYGNEENGPRNYDWALTRAIKIVRAAAEGWTE